MGDDLNYFVLMMTHCLSQQTRYTSRLKDEIPSVFLGGVYDLMTPEERIAVTKCRNAIACPESIYIIDQLLLGKETADMLRVQRTAANAFHCQPKQVRAYNHAPKTPCHRLTGERLRRSY